MREKMVFRIGLVAQLVERRVRNAEVGGSTPPGSTTIMLIVENFSFSKEVNGA